MADKKSKKQQWEDERQRQRQKKQIRLDLENKDRIKDFAEELGVPISQLVDLFIDYGIEGYEIGDLDIEELLEPSRSAVFRYIINRARRKKRGS